MDPNEASGPGDLPTVDSGGTRSTPDQSRNWGLILRLVLGTVIAAAFVTFLLQNTESVEVEFLSWGFSMAQSLLMVLCAAIGVVVWKLAGFISRRVRS